MKKIKTFLCVVLILFILFAGCINNEKDEHYNLTIYIHNMSPKNEEINVKVFTSDSIQIYNKTIEIEKGTHQYLEDITDKKGTYSVLVYIDDNRTAKREDIKFSGEYLLVKIRIHQDEIDLGVEVS